LPSPAASRIAITGRQNRHWYLLYQQPIAPSADARFAIANRRALSAMSSPWLADSARNTRFHSAGPWSCQKIAASVWSAVRVVLEIEPSRLTSLKSSAYASLVSGFGGSESSIATSGTRNGRTFATHGAGSSPNPGGDGRHSPGPEPNTNVNDPPRPSFARAASIAAAAASPAAIPPASAGPSGIAASDAS
jgi:hypothetical protein